MTSDTMGLTRQGQAPRTPRTSRKSRLVTSYEMLLTPDVRVSCVFFERFLSLGLGVILNFV